MRKILLMLLCVAALFGAGRASARLMQKAPAPGQPLRVTDYMRAHSPRTRTASMLPTLAPRHAALAAPLQALNAAGAGSTVYGWLGYTSDANLPTGFTTLSFDGSYSQPVQYCPYTVAGAWMRQGKLYAYSSSSMTGVVMTNSLYTVNLATGTVQETELPQLFSSLPQCAAYDPEEDIIYGYAWTPDGQSSRFFTAPGADPTAFSFGTRTTEYPPTSIGYDQEHRQLLGVVGTDLVAINPVNGETTKLATTPVLNELPTGLCFSPRDGALIWNANYTGSDGSYKSALYKISYPSYTFTKLADYANEEEFVSLICTDQPVIEADAPAEFTITGLSTHAADLQAIVSMTAPSKHYDGTPLTGTVDYDTYLDGVHYASGSTTAGTGVAVTFSGLTEGLHRFAVRGSVGGHQGKEAFIKGYVGNDTPIAPRGVKLDAQGVSWDMVDEGVNGGYVNPSEVTYDVFVNDTQIATGTPRTSMAYTIPEGDMAGYVAKVVAHFAGKTSEPGYSDNYVTGHALQIPVYLTPTPTQFKSFTIEDGNRDGRTWEWTDTNTDDALVYLFSPQNDADDWAFLPAINFPSADKLYEFAADICMGDTRLAEFYEIKIGTEPKASAMTQTLKPRTELTSALYDVPCEASFSVPAAGDYYIGIHALSPADHYYIYARNFRITESSKSAQAPGPATGLKATPAPLGELRATVEFTMPEVDMGGRPLPADQQLTATVTCYDNAVTATGTPGSKCTVDIDVLQGVNMIDIVCANASGSGAQASVKTRCGIDIPGDPLNVTLTPDETDINLTLSWQAPSTVGKNGGYCPPTGITYWLCEEDQMGWNATQRMGTDIYEYQLKLSNTAKQKVYTYGIMAANSEGKSGMVQTASCIAGKPYALPFAETFTPAGPVNGPAVQLTPTEQFTAGWVCADPAQLGYEFGRDDIPCAMITTNSEQGQNYAMLGLAKVSTLGTDDAAFSATVYLGSCDDIEFAAMGYGDTEFTSLGHTRDMNHPAGYNDIVLPLPASLQNRGWVQFFINVSMSQPGQGAILAAYGVDNYLPQDFSVTQVSGPARLAPGATGEYKAVVRNAGYERGPLPAGIWEVRNGEGTVVYSERTPYGDDMAPGETETQVLNLTGDIEFSHEFTVEYYLLPADDRADNNRASMTVWLDDASLQTVTDLKAFMPDDARSVNLTWTEPAIGFVSESFEDEEDGVRLPETIASFKNIDGDGQEVYSDTGIPNQGQPIGFAVMDVYKTMVCTECDGRKVLYTICPSTTDPKTGKCYAADDWLISPRVKGGTEISFMARTFNRYWEDIEIMTSSTGDAPEDFTLLKKLQLPGIEWKKYTYTLPEAAKYFAIHYVSVDQLGAVFDLITYEPEGAGAKVSGYDVERDGQTVATSVAPGGAYADAFAVDASHRYAYRLIPVLRDGSRGLPSNTTYMTTSSLRDALSTPDGAAEYYDLQGRRLTERPASGLYIERRSTGRVAAGR